MGAAAAWQALLGGERLGEGGKKQKSEEETEEKKKGCFVLLRRRVHSNVYDESHVPL